MIEKTSEIKKIVFYHVKTAKIKFKTLTVISFQLNNLKKIKLNKLLRESSLCHKL